MDSNAVALAALGLAGTLAGGFFKLLNKLSKALDSNTDSNKEIARSVDRQANESAERNGHLADQSVKLAKLVNQGNKLTGEIITELKAAWIKVDKVRIDLEKSNTDQHIENQTVKKQVVKSKE